MYRVIRVILLSLVAVLIFGCEEGFSPTDLGSLTRGDYREQVKINQMMQKSYFETILSNQKTIIQNQQELLKRTESVPEGDYYVPASRTRLHEGSR
jgi:hypothetical protein